MNNLVNSIRDKIFETITQTLGISISEYTQIELGHMNLKWKVKTDVGDFFVKQYNKIRYPKELMNGLEISLSQQFHLNKVGIPCPNLFSYEGKYILDTPSGESFVLMESCEGNIIKPGTANEKQMYSLGLIVGRMHQVLNSNCNKDLPLHWDILSKESMLENWYKRWDEAQQFKCDKTVAALRKQKEIIDHVNLELFSKCEKGWGHWDLFVDNILFKPNCVSAILDFDRLNIVYPEFDISRPVLSFCLENGYMHINSVSAFIEGYREYKELTLDKFIRSIKLTWWKEAVWVRVEKEHDSLALRRFREENLWVADNWDKLESVFSNL